MKFRGLQLLSRGRILPPEDLLAGAITVLIEFISMHLNQLIQLIELKGARYDEPSSR